jgi:hypothetical protein
MHPATYGINLLLECQQQLPEGTLAQVPLVEHVDIERLLFCKSPQAEERTLGIVVNQFRSVQLLNRRFDAVKSLFVVHL